MNKFLPAAILLVLIQALTGAFVPMYSCLTRYTDYSWSIATLLALIMMFINGTFKYTRYFALAKFGFGVLVVGFCFKILHLTGADQLLTLGGVVVILAYGVHFIMKRTKTLLDYSKFLVAISFLLSTVLAMFGLASEWITDRIDLVGISLFWITFVLFLLLERKKLWAKKVSTP